MTSSNGNIFRVTGPWCGEFTGHRWIPRTKDSDAERFDVVFDLRLNKPLSKQSWGWWFETPSHPLWRHCNEYMSIWQCVWSISLKGFSIHLLMNYTSALYAYDCDPIVRGLQREHGIRNLCVCHSRPLIRGCHKRRTLHKHNVKKAWLLFMTWRAPSQYKDRLFRYC